MYLLNYAKFDIIFDRSHDSVVVKKHLPLSVGWLVAPREPSDPSNRFTLGDLRIIIHPTACLSVALKQADGGHLKPVRPTAASWVPPWTIR